ncbi:MAG: DUF2163 domain-containing protein [Planctomycetes bacterium]|nr:DUF2163 domain-containing protein [Planctomycetota bacterium]
MKPTNPTLNALLASRQFYVADLYTFTLVDGTVLRYCAGDQTITANSLLYTAGGQTGPYFDRTGNKAKCHWKCGVEVDTLTFDVLPGSATVQGVAFLSAVRQGVFDGAEMQLERAFMPAYGNTAAGTVIMFTGRVAQVVAGRSLATFTVNSHLELLNLNLPRNLYQPGCVNTLFDASCGLNRATFAVTGTASAGTIASVINATLAPATGYFDLGSIVFTNGANSGVSRSVKAYTKGSPGSLSLIQPFPVTPSPGDTFTAYPGCDKMQSTCQNKFGNLANFRGFPFVPNAETAI